MKKILYISLTLLFPLLSLDTNANPISNFKPYEKESKNVETSQTQEIPLEEQDNQDQSQKDE